MVSATIRTLPEMLLVTAAVDERSETLRRRGGGVGRGTPHEKVDVTERC